VDRVGPEGVDVGGGVNNTAQPELYSWYCAQDALLLACQIQEE
jgi:hypothetical protein